MEFFHELKEVDIDITDAVSRHSADESIIYKEVNGESIYLGYYFPSEYDRTKQYSTFVFVHGGGWGSHKIFEEQPHWQGDYLGYLARYYADKGFVSVSIDYRLAKENGQFKNYEIIDCYDDCCDAMDYILVHAKEYGVNTDDMYLLGESAGGHLAGAVASFHYDRQYAFQKVFLVNPITHFEDGWGKRIAIDSTHPALQELSMEEKKRYMAPLFQCEGFAGETVLIHGMEDPTVNPEHSRLLYERLRQLYKPCELHWIEDTQHAFLLAEYYRHGLEACYIAIDIMNQSIQGMTEEN